MTAVTIPTPIYEVLADGTYQITVVGIGTFNDAGYTAIVNALSFAQPATFDVSAGGEIDVTASVAVPALAAFGIGANADGSPTGLGTLTLGTSVTLSPLALVSFEGAGNALLIGNYATLGLGGLVTGIGGWGTGDRIEFTGSDAVSKSFDPVTGILSVGFGAGGTTMSFAPGLTGDNFAIEDGDIVYACFLRGTHLATPEGERRVETLAPGDQVLTASGVSARVIWVGRRRLDCRSLKRPELARPVAIGAGALADAVPVRDLLVSPDHAMFVEGRLIPAGLLVNGASIVQRDDIDQVEYFHVELASHALIVADGAPTESYLDTGNRRFFANGAGPVSLLPETRSEAAHAAWEERACMPLTVDPVVVEPIWRRIAARAGLTGETLTVGSVTTDPDLCLQAERRVLRPVEASGGRYVFALPRDVREIVLRSRAAAPNRRRPWLDDRRVLGVAIGRLALTSGTARWDIALDDPALRHGWWEAERGAGTLFRWTDGAARLTLPGAPEGGRLLEIVLAEAIEYPANAADAGGSVEADAARRAA